MAVFYEFKREDGTRIQRMFPIGECPKEIEDGGMIARRVYCSPNISIQSGDQDTGDKQKLADEVKHECGECGLSELVSLHGQDEKQKLKDIRANKSQFADQMAAANEKSKKKLLDDQRKRRQERMSKLNAKAIEKMVEGRKAKESADRRIVL